MATRRSRRYRRLKNRVQPLSAERKNRQALERRQWGGERVEIVLTKREARATASGSGPGGSTPTLPTQTVRQAPRPGALLQRPYDRLSPAEYAFLYDQIEIGTDRVPSRSTS